MAGAAAVAALSGHARGARDVRHLIRAIKEIGHMLRESVDEILDPIAEEDEGKRQ
jgi:hypothetical protein